MNEVLDKIRDGAIKAKDGAEKITKMAVKKTGNMVSRAKLTYAVSETENKINALFMEMGEILYKEYNSGADFPEDISQICRQIERLYEEIDTVREQIAVLKNAVVCPACSQYNSNDHVFCKKCGERLQDDQVDFDLE